MLPLSSRIAFLLFAAVTGLLGLWRFFRLFRRIARGRPDSETRLDHLSARLGRALALTLLQTRTFRKRPWIGVFHSFIFYGFVLYLLVNLVDALDGFYPLPLHPTNPFAAAYIVLADIFSALVLLGVVALVVRRFLLPSRRDFRFNDRTLLHESVKQGKIRRDSIIVSAFILFHVGSRAVGAAAKLLLDGPDRFQPFTTLVAHAIPPAHAVAFRVFGFWGALGSVLAFLAYFPYTKHIHLFMAPAKYAVARRPRSGVLPPIDLPSEAVADNATEDPAATPLGANLLEDLGWPRLLDAYACIQCNRCQDVCPASATGKSLSPAALEINKRMELNQLAGGFGLSPFETGAPSPRPLLQFALSPEAAWACTTCGACMEVCPVQDEQMLDIVDIRRHQVMIEGDFPAQLQTAFRGMERAQNPWGINRAKRMDWADGLNVPTTDHKPSPDVLYWVGCAASYDPSAQKTARALVQLLDHAGVDYAVLGKKECCTGDSARRAGNEVLYRELAGENVSTLNQLNPKLIVASCPHCMNAIGKEYSQIGGVYKVVHHTEYLETLVSAGKLPSQPSAATVTYHDPCYLGRHNGVYEAPRNLLNILSNSVVELPRARENSFCCGAGGAQFWKEEEPGNERISDNRFREAEHTLSTATKESATPAEKVLAVGCPFCKSMLGSTPLQGTTPDIAIKDIAELLLEGVQRAQDQRAQDLSVMGAASNGFLKPLPDEASPIPQPQAGGPPPAEPAPNKPVTVAAAGYGPLPLSATSELPAEPTPAAPKSLSVPIPEEAPVPATAPERKKWKPASTAPSLPTSTPPTLSATHAATSTAATEPSTPVPDAGQNAAPVEPERKKWKPKADSPPAAPALPPSAATPSAPPPAEQPPAPRLPGEPFAATAVEPSAPARRKWTPKKAD